MATAWCFFFHMGSVSEGLSGLVLSANYTVYFFPSLEKKNASGCEKTRTYLSFARKKLPSMEGLQARRFYCFCLECAAERKGPLIEK